MRNLKRAILGVDQMETRALLSTVGPPVSPTVKADFVKIHLDQAILMADLKSEASTLRTDGKAILTAINKSPSVQSAKNTLVAAEAVAKVTFKADKLAVIHATSSAARTAALTQLQNDVIADRQTIQTDQTAVQSAISNDPTVEAAKAKPKTDSGTIATDRTTLYADYAQLAKDLRAQGGH